VNNFVIASFVMRDCVCSAYAWLLSQALSCVLQFLGTLLFNAVTFNAMLPGLGWFQLDLAIWAPDLLGSDPFL
jgi:hypothetical protein